MLVLHRCKQTCIEFLPVTFTHIDQLQINGTSLTRLSNILSF